MKGGIKFMRKEKQSVRNKLIISAFLRLMVAN